jgi:hypothetical protein
VAQAKQNKNEAINKNEPITIIMIIEHKRFDSTTDGFGNQLQTECRQHKHTHTHTHTQTHIFESQDEAAKPNLQDSSNQK